MSLFAVQLCFSSYIFFAEELCLTFLSFLQPSCLITYILGRIALFNYFQYIISQTSSVQLLISFEVQLCLNTFSISYCRLALFNLLCLYCRLALLQLLYLYRRVALFIFLFSFLQTSCSNIYNSIIEQLSLIPQIFNAVQICLITYIFLADQLCF